MFTHSSEVTLVYISHCHPTPTDVNTGSFLTRSELTTSVFTAKISLVRVSPPRFGLCLTHTCHRDILFTREATRTMSCFLRVATSSLPLSSHGRIFF